MGRTSDTGVPAPEALRLLIARLAPARRTRIVDVGANPLDPPPYLALLAEAACEVVGFEPQPEAFAKLQETKGAHETYLPFAVGDGTDRTLRIYQWSGFTSVFLPDKAALRALGAKAWSKVARSEPLTTVALDTDDRVGPFDLMKIDVQGGELDVFRGAARSLEKATAIVVELRYFPVYQGDPLVAGVDAELRRQGFILHKFLFTKMRSIGNSQGARLRHRHVQDQAIDGDVVYLRRLERLPDCDDEQLKHLCILAAGVFHSHSLVVHVLDLLVARGAVEGDLPAAYVDALPTELRVAD
ncbi:MAG: FkbM family methyltransferase [Gemmobacter sp.]